MPKEALIYFSHDCNASDDVKILFLRQQLGMEGVGIYWYIIERLAQAGGKLPLKVVPVLSMQMQVPDVKTLAVINNFELFTLIEDFFFSNRLAKTIDIYNSERQRMSEGGKRAMAKRYGKKQDSDTDAATDRFKSKKS